MHQGGKGDRGRAKKVANVVKIRDRQSGALCPAGEQYRGRSGDWRIFLRIGQHCWIFQIVFLAYAATKIACRRVCLCAALSPFDFGSISLSLTFPVYCVTRDVTLQSLH